MAKLEKKLAKAKNSRVPAAPAPTPAPASPRSASGDTRTVAQPRAEAKARGVTGYSRMPKAQLVTALG